MVFDMPKPKLTPEERARAREIDKKFWMERQKMKEEFARTHEISPMFKKMFEGEEIKKPKEEEKPIKKRVRKKKV